MQDIPHAWTAVIGTFCAGRIWLRDNGLSSRMRPAFVLQMLLLWPAIRIQVWVCGALAVGVPQVWNGCATNERRPSCNCKTAVLHSNYGANMFLIQQG